MVPLVRAETILCFPLDTNPGWSTEGDWAFLVVRSMAEESREEHGLPPVVSWRGVLRRFAYRRVPVPSPPQEGRRCARAP